MNGVERWCIDGILRTHCDVIVYCHLADQSNGTIKLLSTTHQIAPLLQRSPNNETMSLTTWPPDGGSLVNDSNYKFCHFQSRPFWQTQVVNPSRKRALRSNVSCRTQYDCLRHHSLKKVGKLQTVQSHFTLPCCVVGKTDVWPGWVRPNTCP
jgi:hypothetical protein